MTHQSKKILETIRSRIEAGTISEEERVEFTKVLGLLEKGSGGLLGGAIDYVAGLLEKPTEEVEEVNPETEVKVMNMADFMNSLGQ